MIKNGVKFIYTLLVNMYNVQFLTIFNIVKSRPCWLRHFWHPSDSSDRFILLPYIMDLKLIVRVVGPAVLFK